MAVVKVICDEKSAEVIPTSCTGDEDEDMPMIIITFKKEGVLNIIIKSLGRLRLQLNPTDHAHKVWIALSAKETPSHSPVLY